MDGRNYRLRAPVRLGRRHLLGGAMAAGAAFGLAACGGGGKSTGGTSGGAGSTGAASSSGSPGTSAAQQGQPVKGGTFTIAILGDPPDLDMQANSTYLVNHAVSPVYNQLVRFDPADAKETKIVSDLAKSWEQSGDGLTYTFKLNEGVTFHDGKPFSSEDVKASLERVMNPPKNVVSPRQDSLAVIDKIETPDPTTAVIALKRPAPSLMPILAQGWMSIYSAKDIGGGFDFKLKTNGTGPFQLTDYLRGNRITLKAFEKYFVKGQPYVDGMTVFIIPQQSTLVSSFQSGEILFTSLFTVSDLKSVQSALGNKIVIQRTPALGFNSINFGQHAPWQDARVRQAVTMALDRKAAITLLDEGEGDTGGYMAPSGQWTLSQQELQAIPGYAPISDKVRADAKALLSAAGVKDGFETTILTRQGQSYENLSLFIKDNLAKIGIDAKPQVLESAAAYDALNKRNFDMAPWAHGIALDDPDAIFAEFYLSKAPRNYSEIGSQEVDDLFLKQSQTLDQNERVKLVKEMQQKAMPLYGKVILEWSTRRWVWWNSVQGYTAHQGLYNNQRFAEVWIKK
jgi:peptide/nickel transport system substrate-binding protein